MAKTEKDGKKIAAVLSAASTLPLAGLALPVEQPENGAAEQESTQDWKELDGSTSYFEESRTTNRKVYNSVYARRNENFKRQENRAQKSQDSLSAREVLLSTLEDSEPEITSTDQQPAERQALSIELQQSLQSPALFDQVQVDETQRLIVQAGVPQDIQEAPAAQEMIVSSMEQAPAVEESTITPVVSADETIQNEVQAPAEEIQVEMVQENQAPSLILGNVQAEIPDLEVVALDEMPLIEVVADSEMTVPEQAPALDQESNDFFQPVPPQAAAGVEWVEQAPEQEQTIYEETIVSGDLNDRIAQAALSLVGVTDGLQCTEVVSQALDLAGVENTMDWPSTYLQYGYVVETPTAGNLVYYDNGGNGLDHIAVYVGDGQAVHGNFTLNEQSGSQTLVYDVYYSQDVSPVFIQITE